MFDTICNLPLSSDLIALATHPTAPIFAVGLASGHVQCFRLPALTDAAESSILTLNNGKETNSELAKPSHASHRPSAPHSSKETNDLNKTRAPRRSSLTRRSSSPSPSSSQNGTGTLTTLWRTRRHKGSARALAFSTDGSTLFSAGTDGLLKAADSSSGHVVAKVAVPSGGSSAPGGPRRGASSPNVLLALNPTQLVLGDDAGGVIIYALDRRSLQIVGRSGNDAHEQRWPWAPSDETIQHLYPHRTEDDPFASEPVTSLTALPPSATSSSKVSRAWVSTAGGTLAVSDLHKGVVSVSVEQGGKMGEELLSSVCCSVNQSITGPSKANAKSKATPNANDASTAATILVGDSSGLMSAWSRSSKFQDRSSAKRVHKALPSVGPWEDDAGLECLAVQPAPRTTPSPSSTNFTINKDPLRPALLAAGLGNGLVRFLRLLPSTSSSKSAASRNKPGHDVPSIKLLDDKIHHDDRGLDGVSAIAFDVEGRLLTGGGNVIKVWHPAAVTEKSSSSTKSDDDDEAESDDDEDNDESEDGSSNSDDFPIPSVTTNGRLSDAQSDSSASASSSEEESEASEEEQSTRKRKKRRRDRSGAKAKRNKSVGSHGILGFKGL